MKWIIAGYLLLFTVQQACSQKTQRYTDFCEDCERTIGGTGNAKPCSPSYNFKGKIYTGVCTNANHDRFWCATQPGKYEDHKKWGNCITTTDKLCQSFCKDFTVNGNANRKPCFFPFFFQGEWYTKCTDRKWTALWCSTTSQYNGNWGECSYNNDQCSPKFCEDRTQNGNGDGAPCKVPFEFRGKTYTECTKDKYTKLWCSMSSKYESTKKWGECLPPTCPGHCPDRTSGGTFTGKPCKFPFKYKGKTYTKCTAIDNANKHWCSCSTGTWSKGMDWGNCVYEQKCGKFCTGKTVKGTAKGKPCVFPFEYRGKKYNYCTTKDHRKGKLWCCTTSKYDEANKQWGQCEYTC